MHLVPHATKEKAQRGGGFFGSWRQHIPFLAYPILAHIRVGRKGCQFRARPEQATAQLQVLAAAQAPRHLGHMTRQVQ